MRIWFLHPKYLDAKGLVALWRESLLAKQVLEGNTRGYKNHPQVNRFKNSGNAVGCINQYIAAVYENSVERGFNFNKNKIEKIFGWLTKCCQASILTIKGFPSENKCSGHRSMPLFIKLRIRNSQVP